MVEMSNPDVYKRQSLDSISDELAIYAGIDASPEELEEVLKIIQDFDPAGLGDVYKRQVCPFCTALCR